MPSPCCRTCRGLAHSLSPFRDIRKGIIAPDDIVIGVVAACYPEHRPGSRTRSFGLSEGITVERRVSHPFAPPNSPRIRAGGDTRSSNARRAVQHWRNGCGCPDARWRIEGVPRDVRVAILTLIGLLISVRSALKLELIASMVEVWKRH